MDGLWTGKWQETDVSLPSRASPELSGGGVDSREAVAAAKNNETTYHT